MKIYYSPKFAHAYKKLPQKVKLLAEEREDIFRQNPFDPRLKTHKLKGTVAYHWRIVFHFESSDVVIFDMIGTHEVYR